MIVRIVKMVFETGHIPTFTQLFNERKAQIRAFEGCLHLALWQQTDNPNVFFTYSHWISELHLNQYRSSELFKDTWSKTKILFAAKPEAWSVMQQDIIP